MKTLLKLGINKKFEVKQTLWVAKPSPKNSCKWP